MGSQKLAEETAVMAAENDIDLLQEKLKKAHEMVERDRLPMLKGREKDASQRVRNSLDLADSVYAKVPKKGTAHLQKQGHAHSKSPEPGAKDTPCLPTESWARKTWQNSAGAQDGAKQRLMPSLDDLFRTTHTGPTAFLSARAHARLPLRLPKVEASFRAAP